jgi:NAD(P)H-flavin reductase
MERLAEPLVKSGSPDPMVPEVRRVVRARRDLADVWTLEIEPGDGGFEFAPGQFNMLYAFGVGEAAISISGDPAEPERLVHTIRAVGKVSEALTRLKPGDEVGLRGPFGHGWPVEEAAASDVVVVAGGLGLAPLRPAIHRLLAERRRYGRVAILYGTRSPSDILFAHQLEGWRRRLDIDLEVTVDHAGGDWHGNVGVATTLIARTAFDPQHAVSLVCGPEVMMRCAVAALSKAGLPDSAIHLSLERNMKCAIGLCGHCQFGTTFMCKDGPVMALDRIRRLFNTREI